MERKKLAIALGSGGWRGLAHIGVIKCLVKNNIPIDFIAGSSIGATIGAMYASTKDIKELEKEVNSLTFKSFLKISFKRHSRKAKRVLLNSKIDNFFKKTIGDIEFKDLKIPFCALGADILTGKAVFLKKGKLIPALRASSAIPLLFKPLKIGNKIIVDGGMLHPVPVNAIKRTKADVILGVSLYGGVFPTNLDKELKRLNRIKVAKISRYLCLQRLAKADLKKADISLDLKIPNEDYSFFAAFFKNKEVINYGFNETQKIISQIKSKLKE